jgi:hypothetical protein
VAAQAVNLSHRMIGANQLKTQTGVYVIEIVPVSGADNNHLKVSDIIVDKMYNNPVPPNRPTRDPPLSFMLCIVRL